MMIIKFANATATFDGGLFSITFTNGNVMEGGYEGFECRPSKTILRRLERTELLSPEQACKVVGVSFAGLNAVN